MPMAAPLSCSDSGLALARLQGLSPVGFGTVVSVNPVTSPGGSSPAGGRVWTASARLTRGPVGLPANAGPTPKAEAATRAAGSTSRRDTGLFGRHFTDKTVHAGSGAVLHGDQC